MLSMDHIRDEWAAKLEARLSPPTLGELGDATSRRPALDPRACSEIGRENDGTRLSSAPHLCRPVDGVVADDGDFCC